jgi:glutaconate CoA-transferase subunit B
MTVYSAAELMTVLISRELRDDDIAVTGASSLVPVAACLLAQRLHAPNLTLISPVGVVNPRPRRLYRSASDGRWLEGAEAVGDGYDLFEMSENGRLTVMFYGGLQIDRRGNINLTGVGYDKAGKPKFRGPGLANTSFAVVAGRIILFSAAHSRRNFVEKVDFVTAAGHLDGPGGRERLGISTQGPVVCVTPLATFDFDQTKSMRVRSLHPGVEPLQVIENTGFSLGAPDSWAVTDPPSDEELAVLRRQVDPTGELAA